MTAPTERLRFKPQDAHRRQLLAFGLYAVAALTLLGIGTIRWRRPSKTAPGFATITIARGRSRRNRRRLRQAPASRRRAARCCGRRRSASPPPTFSSGWKPRRTTPAPRRFRRASICRTHQRRTVRSPMSAKSSSTRRAFSRCFTISKRERRFSKSPISRSSLYKRRAQPDACASRWP